MLQWFNKQEKSRSSAKKHQQDRQNYPLSNSSLTEENYEFLFNQLLDGVAHGWHIIRIVKFFDSLGTRSNPADWIAWLNRFEQKIVYANDPSQRRVGAIMMRFNELAQSDSELQELGQVFQRIGKKLFIGDTSQLIWEYDGTDVVVLKTTIKDTNVQSTEENIKSEQVLDSFPELISEMIDESARQVSTNASTITNQSKENTKSENQTEFIPQPASNPNSVPTIKESANTEETTIRQEQSQDKSSIKSLEALTEQLTVLQDASPETDTVIEESNSESTNLKQALENTDLVIENASSESDKSASNPPEIDSPESLEALTQQFALQDIPSKNSDRNKNDTLLETEDTQLRDAPPKTDTVIKESDPELVNFTEQSLENAVLAAKSPSLELDNSVRQNDPESKNLTEQPIENTDSATESSGSESDNSTPNAHKIGSPESLEALTQQLTALQNISLENSDREKNDTLLELDEEPTLLETEDTQTDASASLSVASFLEATKSLIPQQKKQNVTPLSWEEFIAVLEQDPSLARQVAEYLQISSTNPQDIVQAAINRLTKQEKNHLDPATLELIESWFNLGLKQVSAEDFSSAIASWDKALKLNPNLSEAWHNRGSALGRLGKYEEAIQSFNKAINIAPERYQAWNDRAHALYQIQKWQQSVESWDKAISIMPDRYEFWYNRGCALEQLQRYDESISSYEKALEIKPDFQAARTRYINLVTENSSSSAN